MVTSFGGVGAEGAVVDEEAAWARIGSPLVGGTGCASSSVALMLASSERSEVSEMMTFGSRSSLPKCGVDGALGAVHAARASVGADRELRIQLASSLTRPRGASLWWSVVSPSLP